VRAVLLAIAVCACSPSQAPKAKTVGKVMSIGGVSALIAAAFTVRYLGDHSREIVMGLSGVSAIGVGTYAAGELSQPPPDGETTIERHQRWARILTDRAYGYARDGRCWRVRNIDPRVRVYDREHHKTVFMKDPEIVKCLTTAPLQRESEPVETPIESP
jgi:hypothetical protein